MSYSLRASLCSLGVSVVNLPRKVITTEAQRTTEIHTELRRVFRSQACDNLQVKLG